MEYDIIKLPDLAAAQVTAFRSGLDFIVYLNGTGERIIVTEQFNQNYYRIEEVAFADHTVWDRSAINATAGIGGTDGNDFLSGDFFNDVLGGFGGNDTISGGGGNDLLIGGIGKDTLTGGLGEDTFVFQNLADSGKSASTRDLIIDFVVGEDSIDLSAIDAIMGGADDAFAFAGVSAFTGAAGQLAVSYASGQTIVSGDINGDRVADFQIALTGTHFLTADDFIL